MKNSTKRIRRFDAVIDWQDVARSCHYNPCLIAQLWGVSSRSLERYFVEFLHASPGAWMRELQMSDAATLLLEGKQTIKEIAFRVGFKSSNHFGKSFKKFHRCTPSNFVLKNRALVRTNVTKLAFELVSQRENRS